MASDEGRKVTLKSSDGEEFLVEETVAMESQTIRYMIEDGCADGEIPLPNVNSRILSKVIEYCKKHVEAAGGDEKPAEEDLKDWDSDFVKVEQAMLLDLILAANYLKIIGLLDLTCQTATDMIKGKAPKEIHKFFNIKNHFTPEEEEEMQSENQSAFEEKLTLTSRERLINGFKFLFLYLIVYAVLTFWLSMSMEFHVN